MSRTRWVAVDDSLGGFEYEGDWFQITNTPTYSGTLHGTNSTGTMKFTFQGVEMNLLGRIVSGNPSPRYTCSVDGVAVEGGDSADQFSCPWKGAASSTPHTLTLNADPGGGTIAVDAVWFQPHLQAELPEGAEVQVDHDDPTVSAISGDWTEIVSDGTRALVATEPGSSLNLTFSGTRISWEGWRIAGYPTGNSTGTYSIDGGAPIPFVMQGPDPPSTTIRGRVLFQRSIGPGTHTLSVTYDGPGTPIVLDHFLVQNGDFLIPGISRPDETSSSATPSGTANPSIDDSPAPSPSPSPSSEPAGTNVGAIAGGVVSGVVALVLLILAFLWYKKKAKARATGDVHLDSPTSFVGGMASNSQANLVPPPSTAPGNPSSHITPFNVSQLSQSNNFPPTHGYTKPSMSIRSTASPHTPSLATAVTGSYEMDNLTQSGRSPASNATGSISGSSSKQAEARNENRFTSPTAHMLDEVYQHHDSGIRVSHRTELPPVYSPN